MKRRTLDKNFVCALCMTITMMLVTCILYVNAEIRDANEFQMQATEIQEERINFKARNPAVVRKMVIPRREKAETMYSLFTNEEIRMLEAVVQREAGCFSKKYKSLTAEAIYNRLVSDNFPDGVSELLLAEDQFTGFERYWNSGKYAEDIDDETREVVKEVFSQHRTSHEAVYYYNPKYSSDEAIDWFENSGDLEYLFSYEEIGYTTRFFKENEKDR